MKSKLIGTLVLLLTVMAAFTLQSCVKEEFKSYNRDNAISFTPGIESPATKAGVNKDVKIDNLDKIRVYAYYTSDNSEFFDDTFGVVDAGGAKNFVSDTPHYWPSTSDLKFETFYPLSLESCYRKNGNHRLEYTFQTDILNQEDVLVGTAFANQASGRDGVPLTMKHILSQIRIHMTCTKKGRVIEMDALKISNLRFKAMYYFTRDKNIPDGTWVPSLNYVPFELDMSSNPLKMDGSDPKEYGILSVAEDMTYTVGPAIVIPDTLNGLDFSDENSTGTYLAMHVRVTDNKIPTYPMSNSGIVDGLGKQGFAWLAVPLTVEMKQGQAYKLFLNFDEGLGFVSPEGADGTSTTIGPYKPRKRIIDTSHPLEFVITEVEDWGTPEEDEIVFWQMNLAEPEVTPWTDSNPDYTDWRHVERIFEVSDPSMVPYTGGTSTCTVKSYAEYVNVDNNTAAYPTTYKKEPWTAEFYDMAGRKIDRPDWLLLDSASSEVSMGTDGITGAGVANNLSSEQLTVRFNALSKTVGGNALHREAVVDYDLSMHGVDGSILDGITTANSYVVTGPGTYMLPLVYGNAVKEGNVNEVAFHPASVYGPATNWCGRFLNSKNLEIQSAFIAEDGFSPASAEVVWNDASSDFISVVGLVDKVVTIDSHPKTVKYLKFSIPDATIKQGNAVLAVKDASDNILWSWHIWVTAEDLTPVSGFMPVNLGWCSASGSSDEYVGVGVRVKFTQTATGYTHEVVFRQNGASRSNGSNGYSPYYQWGRKDPLYPMDGITGFNDDIKTLWNSTGVIVSSVSDVRKDINGNATIGSNIRNPLVFSSTNAGSYGISPNTTPYHNLWNAGNTAATNTATSVVKTIYDPCPAGFTMPVASNFASLGSGSFANNGYSVGGLFFPACGWMTESGSFGDISSNGRYWEALPYPAVAPAVPTTASSHLFPYSGSRSTASVKRVYGLSVRPVVE